MQSFCFEIKIYITAIKSAMKQLIAMKENDDLKFLQIQNKIIA